MKSRGVIIYCIFCLLAFFSGVFAGRVFVISETPEEISAKAPADIPEITEPPRAPEPENTQTAGAERFMLNLSGDDITVYRVLDSGETELIYKKYVDVLSLRQDDYESLCGGIFVESEERAREIVEDFIS